MKQQRSGPAARIGPAMAAPAGSPPLLTVEDLRVSIPSARGVVRAVDGVSFAVRRGTTLGIVGESGSGKSMLARSVMGITPAGTTVQGRIVFDGADLRSLPRQEARAVLGTRIAMVFQDPTTSLNPVVRIGRQLTEAPRKHLGLSRGQATARAVELLAQVGISEPERRLHHFPHQLSGGMRQRVTIAMALACDPDLLIADEVTTALDVTVQKQILDLLSRIQRDRGMAMIMISHDLGVVAGRTDETAVMYAGRLVERAPTRALFHHRKHQYTEALLRSIPRLDHPRHEPLRTIEGAPPDLVGDLRGCPFAPRCPAVVHRCRVETPSLVPAERPDHVHACYVPVATRNGARGPGGTP